MLHQHDSNDDHSNAKRNAKCNAEAQATFFTRSERRLMCPNDHVAPWTRMHKLPIKTCFSELHHSMADFVPESIHAASKETRKEATDDRTGKMPIPSRRAIFLMLLSTTVTTSMLQFWHLMLAEDIPKAWLAKVRK